MSALIPVCSVFDQFEKSLSREGADSALKQIVADLASVRASLAREDWKKWCAAASSHPAFSLLMQDPYTRDARLKPGGYAGDARTLDYVYLRTPGAQPITDLGRTLFDVSTGMAIADAVRFRCFGIAQNLNERLKGGGTLAAASIACGHAHELDFVPAETHAHLHFSGIDQDDLTINACRIRFATANFNFGVGSVAEILRGARRLPDSDLSYASGLFDYLGERVAAALIRRMSSALKPGGALIIANLTNANEEIAYMEAVMDWWMNYRDESGMAALAGCTRLDPAMNRISTYTTTDGRVAWLVVERVA